MNVYRTIRKNHGKGLSRSFREFCLMKSSFKRFYVVVVLSMLCIGAIAVWFFCSLSDLPKEIRHIVLISIDTCRADYLSCYGYSRRTTPNIDKFAQDSILFTNAISPVPMTLPAHCSMLAGTIPPYHGIHDNFDYRLDEANVTLAEVLKENGFTTGAIISAFVLDSQFGLDQGFDTYNDKFEEEHKTLSISERKGNEASRFALQWLDQHKKEKFFLFLHYYDPHYGYEPPEPFSSKFADSPYAGEIAYTDDCIGQVIKKLKDLGIYDSSLIIIVGDHGEMLGEHGENTHMYFIYQSAIKVPLLLKFPGQGKGERDEPVGIIDIVPTICGALGIDAGPDVQGIDLFDKSLAGKDRYVYCESLQATKYGANSLLGVVTPQFKYIQTTRPELYDLVADPQEMKNLVNQQPHRARILKDRLKQILEQSVRKEETENTLQLDEQARKRLESLGYIAGSVTEDFDFDQNKDDPKDLISVHAQNGRAHYFLSQQKYEEAKTICEKMVQERPQSVQAYIMLARIATEQGDFEGSLPHLYRALEVDPNQYEAHNGLGTALTRLGKHEEGLKHFEESVRLQPKKPELLINLAWSLYKQERFDEAIPQYIKALEIDPDHAEAHFYLGKTLAKQGKLDEAVRHWNDALRLIADRPGSTQKGLRNNIAERLAVHGKFEEAISLWNEIIQLDPNSTTAHKNLGAAFLKKAQAERAIIHLTKALESSPDNYEIHHNIATAFSRSGNAGKAVTHWRKAVELKPNQLGTLNDLAWILATHTDENLRNPAEAVELSERACELTGYEDPYMKPSKPPKKLWTCSFPRGRKK